MMCTSFGVFLKVCCYRWDVIVKVGVDCGVGCRVSSIESIVHVAVKIKL